MKHKPLCEEGIITSFSNIGRSGNTTKQQRTFDEENHQKNHQKEIEALFNRLHRRQQKFSPADFLQIGPPLKPITDTPEKDVAQAFLQRLMALDYRARYIPVQPDSSEVNSQSLSVSETVSTDDDDIYALFSRNEHSDQSKQNLVHPMDVQMVVFHCSDNFLKQNMITKLSQCQYALPLLVPDLAAADIECPLWTFRQIRKTWKKTEIKDNSKTVTIKSLPICKAETPVVSFFRLGSLSQSKSQLMNTLINDRHNTFFHRNCQRNTKSRHVMDEVVEIAWYCPAGKGNDSFSDCIAFCNLHGDSLLMEKQREILTEISSVLVVLVPAVEKGQENSKVVSTLFGSPNPLIVLTADNDCGAVEIKPQKYKVGLKDRSQSDISEELKGIIRQILSGSNKSFKLELMSKITGVRVDEDDTVCQNGISAAMNIVKLIQDMDVYRIKDTFLPCQGQLWHEWCRTKKETFCLRGNIEEEKSQKDQQLMQIRQKQCAASCSELMKSFTDSLMRLEQKDKEYFLKWTQILIDELSSKDLSAILKNYDEKWSEVLDLKKHDKFDQLKSKQAELEEISNNLQAANFGLEHIFREMAQIYEAHQSLKKQTHCTHTEWDKYPELAADLMISLELMDGDAVHLPLTWISGLLQEVIKKLSDQRVFVLSVLGVQSSGKSTMLNAMFGLQFAVSAGRCTKGAYMQLVKLSEEIKKEFKFDYILVVDTEGLRALELEGSNTLHHDNELATFVVGLGNMTLINIFGENPAEMQDLLQIVVQAVMRMKKVQLSPSCVFVHQNVTDVTAVEKNMDGKRRLQEKLDKMAQLAAKEEGCEAECFSDIIAFDVQKDVKYFAQLWEGSPPMAPPNPGYSESVQELKSIILSKASESDGIKLSHFSSKIQDLWNALMNENFVFSFKNTQEISVYRKLEVQYGSWTWTLRSEMLTIQNQLHPQIENGQLNNIELSDLSKRMSRKYEEIKTEITDYFENDTDKELLVQWRGRFENKIKDFHQELLTGLKRKLDEVIQQKKACKKLEEKKTDFENQLLQKSKDRAHTLREIQIDEEELQMQFDSVWSHWVEELTTGIKPIEDINLEEDQFNVLQSLGFEWTLCDELKSSEKYKKLPEKGNYSKYINFKMSQKRKTALNYVEEVMKLKSRLLSHEDQEQIRSFIKDVQQKSLKIIQSKPVTKTGYTSTYLHEVAKTVQENVTELESKMKITFKKEFTVDLLLFVFHMTAGWILQSHKQYKDNNDAVKVLNRKKNEYFSIFNNFCRGSSSVVVFGEIICEKLKVSAVEAVCNQTAVDLAGELRKKIEELTHKLRKTKIDEMELKRQFDSVWSDWVEELTSGIKPIEDIHLEEDQFAVLQSLGFEWTLCDKLIKTGKYKKLPEKGNYSKYFFFKMSQKFKAAWNKLGEKINLKSEPLSHEDQEQIRSFIEDVQQKSLKIIQSKPVSTQGYTSTYLHEVAKTVQENVTELESKMKITFKKEFTVDLLLFVLHMTAGWILKSHKQYKDNNDALTYLNRKKDEYFTISSSFCKGSSSVEVFGEIICENLKVSAVEAVCNQTAVDLAGELRSNVPAFNGNRLKLEKHVLKDLAEKEDFNRYITYIRNPREQVENFIREQVKTYISVENKDKAQKILQKNVDDIQKLISQSFFEATEKFKTEKGEINMWMKEFSSLLSCKLTLDTISCQNFTDVNDLDFLRDEIEKGLQTITKEMKELPVDEVMKYRQKPDDILIEQLCNCCWERCPFCAAVCINTIKDHSPEKHSVPFHRPSGVEGWHRKGTVDLVIDFCTTLVASDRSFYPSRESEKRIPFKQYQTAGGKYASWSITADGSTLKYWKWFVCRFQKELEDYYKLKFQGGGKIPSEWRKYSKEEALESLNEMSSL
ncbi:interferon-induced very large GTPase 1 [Oryzias latipes]|uniref:VLIG-type G domain-containing protein n=1 Tax=Oryzias latipes TaxID=8090 RepID=A0A3B3HUR4_ORYLA|nr:interferon-induced very large GTPase 1 [Oryzias latipes]